MSLLTRFLIILAGSLSSLPAVAAEPNVVIVLVDDLGAADLGCSGSAYYETPAIDRLAREGMRFTNAYAACAVCSPTRAAVMTGRSPTRTGVTDWIRPLAGRPWTEAEVRAAPPLVDDEKRVLLTPRNPRWLERSEVTMAEVLRARGYTTAFIGKWHLGPEGWFPESQGFDVNAGGCDLGHPPSWFDPYPPKHQRSTFPSLAPRHAGEYLTDREADEAVRFIRAHRERPFLLMLCPHAVHSPIRGKPDIVEHYRAKAPPEGDGQNHPPYAAMVHSVDEAVGRVLATLDELDLARRTLVIFTSDNGGATHFRATDNRPLRSGKGRPYEGGIRVPLIVRWPGRVKAGSVSDVPVSSIDLLPTVGAAVGAELPVGHRIDGVDLGPLLAETGTLERDTLCWHYPHYWWGGRVTPYSIIRRGDWKLIRWYETGVRELFDLATDPGEASDVAPEHRALVAELDAALDRWLEETGAIRPRRRANAEPSP
ncbi:MAG: sulfatase [Planctomycetes bacterium]|nr:sulfatase [Planctomycetota bacterium]